MDECYTIRPVTIGPEVTPAMELVWSVFLEFEAPDYSEEGIREFRDYIQPDAIQTRLTKNELFLWACYDGDRTIGVIAARPPCHVSLLFVDKACHRRGIARALYGTMLDHFNGWCGCNEATVHSSPYATDAYRRLGFVPTGAEQTVNGLRFTPMKHIFR